MSLKSIYLFQSKLYERLVGIASLPKTYLSVQQDAKYPFILINLFKVYNLSEYTLSKYAIDFEICVFGRDKSQENILSIATKIEDAINPTVFNEVLSIKVQNVEWVRAHDLLTTKLVINYKGLLEHKADDSEFS